MKKSFLKTFIVLGIFSIFLCGSFEFVNAEMGDESFVPVELQHTLDVDSKEKDLNNAKTAEQKAQAQLALDKARQEQAASLAAANASGCGIALTASGFQCVIRVGIAELLIAMSRLVAWVVSFAGSIFDKSIAVTTSFPAESWGGSVYGAWKIIRDFTNIILVFSLLYLGIKTILDGQGFAEKRTLAGILIAAVLINFSFMFTKDIVFNLSNLLGLQVLEHVKSAASNSYSAGLMNIVDPQRLIANSSAGAASGWPALFAYAGQLLIFSAVVIMLGIIFIGVSFILIYRFIIFIILIIASPLGFVSTQIPWLKQYGSKWSESLKQQAIFFPAFSLILYIVLLICSGLSQSLPTTLTAVPGSTESPIFLFLFYFTLIIGFMLGLLILPSMMGVAGAKFMTSANKSIVNGIRNMPKRSGQFAGRNAANLSARTGRIVGTGLSNKLGLVGDKNKAARIALQEKAQGTGAGAALARARLRTADKLKDRTYDFRNTKLGGSLGLGKGIESYNAAVAAKKKKLEDRKKKEEKLFGFDKAADSEENKNAIAAAEGDRTAQEKEVEKAGNILKQAQIAHTRATANGGTATAAQIQALNDARVKHDAEKKALEKEELKVGKLKNAGDLKYMELMKKRRERMWNRMSRTEKAAHEKMIKEMEKKWKEDGKSKKKKNKPASPTVTVSGASGAGAGSSSTSSGGP